MARGYEAESDGAAANGPIDFNEHFPELDPERDALQAEGPGVDDAGGSAEGADRSAAAGDGDMDALAATGDAIGSLVDQIVADDRQAGWGDGEEAARWQMEMEQDALAVGDALEAEGDDRSKAEAIESIMAKQGEGFMEAAGHLTAALAETQGKDATQVSQEALDRVQAEGAAVSDQIERTNGFAAAAATAAVGALRTTAGSTLAVNVSGGAMELAR